MTRQERAEAYVRDVLTDCFRQQTTDDQVRTIARQILRAPVMRAAIRDEAT